MTVKEALSGSLATTAALASGCLDDAHQRHLFDRLSWYQHVANSLDPSSKPLIASTMADGEGAFLFLAQQDGRQITSLVNWYSLAYRPVFSRPMPAATRATLLTILARSLRGKAATMALWPLPIDDGTGLEMEAAFRQAGWLTRLDPYKGHWFLNPDTMCFEDYWAERPARLRNTHNRKCRAHGLTVDIHHRFTDDLWRIYEEIYAASWKEKEGDPLFLRAFAEACGNVGSLRLGIARHAGAPVAAQLWTVDQGRAIIHKLAYREDAHHMSPGTILSAAMFRHAMDEDKVSHISYGTGDDSYKRDWVNQREQLFTLSLWDPRSPRALADFALRHAHQWFKSRKG